MCGCVCAGGGGEGRGKERHKRGDVRGVVGEFWCQPKDKGFVHLHPASKLAPYGSMVCLAIGSWGFLEPYGKASHITKWNCGLPSLL